MCTGVLEPLELEQGEAGKVEKASRVAVEGGQVEERCVTLLSQEGMSPYMGIKSLKTPHHAHF